MMKTKYIIALLPLCFFTFTAVAQTTPDTDIFRAIQEDGQISIEQNKKIENAVRANIERNVYKKTKGYRIRIFFDNNQTARNRSEAVALNFKRTYPDVPVYRVFEDLYFKVTVGDFRTKSDAMRFMQTISGTYPAAFITSEFINLLKTAQEAESIALPVEDSTTTPDEIEE